MNNKLKKLRNKLLILSTLGVMTFSPINNNIVCANNNTEITEEQENEKSDEIKEIIENCSKKYKINQLVIMKIVSTQTGRFNNKSWLESYYLNGKEHKSMEEAIDNICNDIKNNPDRYKQFLTENEYSQLAYADKEISYYSSVFQMDKDLVRKVIVKKTNNFKNKQWEKDYYINEKSHKSLDYAILDICEDIYFNTDKYKDCLTENEYNNLKNGESYTPELSFEEMIDKYGDYYEVNKAVAGAIAYCECGSGMNSDNYLSNNNPAGIGPFNYYINKEVGVISFMRLLKYGYGCTLDSGEGFLNSIAGTYCEIPDHWLSLTLPNYRILQNDIYAINPKPKHKDKDSEYIVPICKNSLLLH